MVLINKRFDKLSIQNHNAQVMEKWIQKKNLKGSSIKICMTLLLYYSLYYKAKKKNSHIIIIITRASFTALQIWSQIFGPKYEIIFISKLYEEHNKDKYIASSSK